MACGAVAQPAENGKRARSFDVVKGVGIECEIQKCCILVWVWDMKTWNCQLHYWPQPPMKKTHRICTICVAKDVCWGAQAPPARGAQAPSPPALPLVASLSLRGAGCRKIIAVSCRCSNFLCQPLLLGITDGITASQAFIERILSLCGMLTAGRRNRMKKTWRCGCF